MGFQQHAAQYQASLNYQQRIEAKWNESGRCYESCCNGRDFKTENVKRKTNLDITVKPLNFSLKKKQAFNF